MPETYYKVLNDNGSCFHGGNGKWPLPEGTEPGAWMPKIEELKMCALGYHILRAKDLISWLGPAIFEVEAKGEILFADDKAVTQQARLVKRFTTWNDRTARLFACDCADAVRHLMKDKRSTDAIDIARRFANGAATKEEFDAAWAAAEAAAMAAAAGAAAGAAAWDAAHAAAREAQTKRLFEYLEGKVQ